jgi:DNA-binding transcriptional ArsR family regulator
VDSAQLDATFAALADPTRRAILARLRQGDATVSQLAEPFAMSMPAVSRHLKVLEKAGLISRNRYAQARPSHLEARPLKAATDWMTDYEKFWTVSFDALGDLLKEKQR